MIAKLTGSLDRVYDDAVLIDVNGIGYRVFVSKRSLRRMPELTRPLVLWTETVIRNEQPHLCGFLEEAEARWFTILTMVQGVGAKVALAILSALNLEELTEAIVKQKSALLAKADGVGAKLAGRIVLELKDKKGLPIGEPRAYDDDDPTPAEPVSGEFADAVSALVNLGYNKNAASAAVAGALKNSAPSTLENLIVTALREFKNHE